jgi:hypothetical protein
VTNRKQPLIESCLGLDYTNYLYTRLVFVACRSFAGSHHQYWYPYWYFILTHVKILITKNKEQTLHLLGRKRREGCFSVLVPCLKFSVSSSTRAMSFLLLPGEGL